jgi:predicted outer membrane repeat protein
MSLPALPKAARRPSRAPRPRPAPPRGARFRPCLEALEARLAPSTFTVTGLGDAGAGSGLQGDLRYAVNAANANADLSNRIVFQPGLAGTLTLANGPLVVSKALEVDGPGAALLTVSGGRAAGVFAISAGANQAVLLSDLSIAGGSGAGAWQGHAAGGGLFNDAARLALTRVRLTGNALPAGGLGGGLFNARGTVTLTSCTLSDNHADGAGADDGALANFGTLTLTDCTVSGNTAWGLAHSIENGGTLTCTSCLISANRGGILNTETLRLTTCTVSDNVAANGAGLENRSGQANINLCTFANNFAEDRGGGIFMPNGQVTIGRTTFSGNTATYGGGLFTEAGEPRLNNCTVSGNTAARQGGGIYYTGGVMELADVTITLNATTDGDFDGGGGGGVFSSSTRGHLRNTIVAGNRSAGSGPDILGPMISLGHNLIGQTDGSIGDWRDTDLTGTSAQPLDARLGPLADYGGPNQTHAPLADSPALGTGDPTQNGRTDQRGSIRRNSTIGAVEAGTAVRFQLVVASRVEAGAPFQVLAVALDQWGNRASTYTGTVHLSSTDFAALLPADVAFGAEDLGAHTFTLTLRTAGSQRLRAADAGGPALLGELTVPVSDPFNPFRP